MEPQQRYTQQEAIPAHLAKKRARAAPPPTVKE